MTVATVLLATSKAKTNGETPTTANLADGAEKWKGRMLVT
jgi:hypothetical protein